MILYFHMDNRGIEIQVLKTVSCLALLLRLGLSSLVCSVNKVLFCKKKLELCDFSDRHSPIWTFLFWTFWGLGFTIFF